MPSMLRVASIALVVTTGSFAMASGTSLSLAPFSQAGDVVANTTSSAPGFGPGSWQGSATTASGKAELYIASSSLFSQPVHVSDIQSVSYWTNKSGNAGAPDWTFYIYTDPTSQPGNTASWYRSRLNSEPYLTGTSAVASNTWHQWSTDDVTNPMRFYDADPDRGGTYGRYDDPTLAELQAGAFVWQNSNVHDYRSETVKYFSLQTGTPWANGFNGLVDGLTITLTNGDVATVNLVPSPGAAAAFGLAGLVGLRRRR